MAKRNYPGLRVGREPPGDVPLPPYPGSDQQTRSLGELATSETSTTFLLSGAQRAEQGMQRSPA